MTLDIQRMGDRMLVYWNKAGIVDEVSVNRLGDAIYDGMMSIVMDQQSDPDGSLGRQRARETARAILEELMNTAGDCAERRFRLLARAIIDEIWQYAEILPLTVTNTPADGPGHTHAPAVTVQVTGKIK